MVKRLISELQGAELDAAVAIAEGWVPPGDPFFPEWLKLNGKALDVNWPPVWLVSREVRAQYKFHPPEFSQDWSHGGPIIEREQIGLEWFGDPTGDKFLGWIAAPNGSCIFRDGLSTNDPWSFGPSPLVAAMRAYLSSKYGEEMEVPAVGVK
jgi:hypothetical protein